jgi:putative Ca2+/H+ antiporter (TMEM165/GDT1 family)
MDLRIVLTTFSTVFLAELGDKTQLAVFSLSAATSSRLSVFLGAAFALVASSALAVLVADRVARYVNPRWTQGAAGTLLVAMGIWYVVGALRAAR